MKWLLLLFFSFTLFAQDYGNNAETLELCTTLQSNSFSSDLNADNALDRILSVVGLSKNFVLSPCSDINNAVAVSYKGVRYILYDPEFMSMLSSNTSNWTNLFILAHEVGHHVNGHSLDLVLYAGDIVDAPELEKKRQQELEADEFAGFVLAKLGASLAQTTSSVSKLSNEDDTYSTHPKRDKRVASISKGWDKGFVKKAKDKIFKNDNYIKPEYKKSGNWESYLSYKREERKQQYKDEGLDPFRIALFTSRLPVKSKEIYADGYSYDGEEKITLKISFEKWNNKFGVSEEMVDKHGIEWVESVYGYYKIRNSISYTISFKDYMSAPKYTNDKELAEKFPDYKLEIVDDYVGFIAKVSYMIDDTVRGHFYASITGYIQDYSPTLPYKIGTPQSQRIKNENYGKPKAQTWVPLEIGFNWAPDDFDYLHNNFLKFIEGIKNGKTLYMRIENKGYANSNSKYQTYNNLIKPTTYVFDLKGSSKAIGQYKGDL